MAEPAGTKCKRDVKDDRGRIVKCDTFLPRGKPDCQNKKNHMWKFKSGFCNSGWCEGTTAKDSSGKYVRTCHLWNQCNCDCHKSIDKMFILSDEPRILIENSKYVPVKSPYVMPSPLDIAREREQEQAAHAEFQKPALIESKAVRYQETPTGKRARGQLEYEVLRVCKAFVAGQLDVEVLTPNAIAMDIDEVEPPSVGAIGAVFDRWVKLGFANCEKGPVRFISFTVEGQLHGLDALKARAKQQNKMKQAANARGTLRLKK